MAWQRTSGSAGQEASPSRLFLAASYLVLFVGGAVLAFYGALLLPVAAARGTRTTTPGAGSGTTAEAVGRHVLASSGGGVAALLSVGLLIAIVANPLLSLAGLWTAGTRLAAFTPLIGWLAIVLPMASGSSQGDAVLPSDSRSVAFLLIGALAFTAVATLGRPTRGFTALSGQPAARPGNPPPPVAATRPRKAAPRRTAPKGRKRR